LSLRHYVRDAVTGRVYRVGIARDGGKMGGFVPGRRKPYRVGRFVDALRELGVGSRASASTIIRMCNAGKIEHERRGSQGQRFIFARELKRVARILMEKNP